MLVLALYCIHLDMSKSSNHSKASAAPSTVDMVGLDVEEKGKSLREFFSYPFSSDETFQVSLWGLVQSLLDCTVLII